MKAVQKYDTTKVKEEKNVDLITNKEQLSLGINGNQNLNITYEINTELSDKVYEQIVKIQESSFAPMDNECLVEDDLDNSIIDEINAVKASGAFVPINGLTLIYGGDKTTKVFAKLVVRNSNRGEPVIVFVYTDGTVSPELEISKAELMRISYGNYGENHDSLDKKDLADARSLIKKVGNRILPYWEFDIGIGVVELLKILSKSISTLKIDRGNELNITMVYSFIYKYVQKLKGHPNRCYLIRRGFYALLKEDMLEIASGMNSTVPEIVKILKQNNILYLQPSSVGNQCEVKGVGSCYCIKMLAKYQADEAEIFSDNVIDEL